MAVAIHIEMLTRWVNRFGRAPVTRNNKGIAHENGAIESTRRKNAIRDALPMRGSRDFDSIAAYRAFVDEIISRHNANHGKRIHAERPIRCWV